MTEPTTSPSRAQRLGAALVALLMVGSLARSFLRPAPAADAAGSDAAEATPSPDAATTRPPARIEFEVQADVKPGEPAPPLRLRLRTRDGVQPAFDLTTRDEPVRARFRVPLALPVAYPELPLRGEVVGTTWCIPPGTLEFEVRRLDVAYQLTLARARPLVVVVAGEDGRPLAGASVVHESGRVLGTTAADGRAPIVVAVAHDVPALFARADGFTIAQVDGAAPSMLRATKSLGRLRGVVRDAQGGAVADASLVPHWTVSGAAPTDPAGVALWRAAQTTAQRTIPALALASDAQGRFELPIAFPGEVSFAVQQRQLGATVARFVLDAAAAAAGATTDVEIRYPRRIALTVALTLDGGAASQGRVELVSGGDGAIVAAGVADAKGVVALAVPDLPGLCLVARGDAAATRVAPFDAGGRDAVQLDVALERGRAATFAFATSGDASTAGLPLEARDHESGVLLEAAVADAKGRGRFKHLPVGRALDLLAPALGSPAPLRASLVVEAAEADVDLGTFDLKHD